MNVHNLMEDLAYTEVNGLFDTAKESKAPWLTCSCNQCRLDTICYVLNRIQPHYIKSGRGLAYSQLEDFVDKTQITADINKLGLEGMKQVLATKRPHSPLITNLPDSPVFNFPTFVGRILDGRTFEPIQEVSVLLFKDSKKAESIDSSWENPYRITEHTPGAFTFWVKPFGVKDEGIKKVFSFEIQVDKKGYDPLKYYFELGITSESFLRTAYSAEHSYILPDLHLFPISDGLENMQD